MIKYERFAKLPKGYVRVGRSVTINRRTFTMKDKQNLADGLYQVAVNQDDAHLETARTNGVSIEQSLECPGVIVRRRAAKMSDVDDFITIQKNSYEPKGAWRCFMLPFKVWRVKKIRRAT